MRNPEPARCPICDVRLSRVPADHERDCAKLSPETRRKVKVLDVALDALAVKRAEIDACTYCQANKGQMHPPHFASANCQSGRRNHCSCSICF